MVKSTTHKESPCFGHNVTYIHSIFILFSPFNSDRIGRDLTPIIDRRKMSQAVAKTSFMTPMPLDTDLVVSVTPQVTANEI